MRKTTIVYAEWSKLIKPLSDDDAGRMFKNILDIANGIDIPETGDPIFDFIRHKIIENRTEYIELCAKNKNNINKRWNTNEYERIPEENERYESIPKDKDKDKDKELPIVGKAFKKPTIEELRAYIQEHKYPVDAQAWLDHYTSNGWKVGKNPMKDWKAAVRTWVNIRREKKEADPNSRPKQKAFRQCIKCDVKYQGDMVFCPKCEKEERGKTN